MNDLLLSLAMAALGQLGGFGAAPGYGAPPGFGAAPGMPNVGGLLATRLDGAQSSIKAAGGAVGAMRIGFLVLGGLLVVGGIVTCITSGLGFGIGLLVTGVTLGATGWFGPA